MFQWEFNVIWYHLATFDYYKDKLVNWSFILFIRKLWSIENVVKGNKIIEGDCKNTILKHKLKSILLEETLEKGTILKR